MTHARKCAYWVAILALSACGGGGSGDAVIPVEFMVKDVLPRNESSGVPLGAEINVIFSREVDPATLTPDSLRVVTATGSLIPGTRLVATLNRSVARFLPLTSYVPDSTHRLVVTRGVRDVDGSSLDREYAFEFQTEPAGPEFPHPSQIENLGNLLQIGRWFHRMTLLPSNRFLIAGGYVGENGLTAFAENLIPVLRQNSIIPATMVQPRAAHVQVLLADGRVLIAGGEISSEPFVPTASCEIFDPATFRFEATSPLSVARSFASAVRVADGRVLVTGGQGLGPAGVVFLDDAEIYDPKSSTWTAVSSRMSRPRSYHASFLLTSTDVLVMSGTSGEASAELWDPLSGAFAPLISPGFFDHYLGAAATLSDGRPFMAGGLETKGVSLYDSSFGFLSGLNEMVSERAFATATALPDGRVLVAGGFDLSAAPPLIHDTIDLFIPGDHTGRIYRVPNLRLPVPTTHHAAALDPEGNLWIVGGLPSSASLPGLRQVTVLREP